MNETIFCNNCGKCGHLYHQCKLPITSIGIIAFKIKYNEIHYLLIRRKDTLGYVDFLRGKYPLNNIHPLMNMLNEMTIDEKKKICYEKFSVLWKKLWGENIGSNSYQRAEEKISSEKLKQLREGIIISNVHYNLEELTGTTLNDWIEPEWGFPKGRRDNMENDLDCAMREWEEETGYSSKHLTVIKNLLPVEEIFMGSNYKSYKHKYYIAMFDDKQSNIEDKCDSYERNEVGKMEWKTYEDACACIRPYNFEKKKVLNQIDTILSTHILYK